MKLSLKFSYEKNNQYSISEAVKFFIESYEPDSMATYEILAKILEILVEKNLLEKQELLELLVFFEEKEK